MPGYKLMGQTGHEGLCEAAQQADLERLKAEAWEE